MRLHRKQAAVPLNLAGKGKAAFTAAALALLLTACATQGPSATPAPAAGAARPGMLGGPLASTPGGPRVRPFVPQGGDCIARPIAAEGRSFGPLRFEGGFELEARSSLFGGLSGLEAIDESRLLAVTDQGALVFLDLSTDQSGAPTVSCAIAELRDAQGLALYGKADGDAEDLTLLAPDRIAVSFERNHRIATFTLADPILQDGPAIDFSSAARLEDNQGLESLALLPSGALLAGVETPTVLGARQGVWRLPSLDAQPSREPDFGVAAGSGFALVALDATPRGGLVVLQRFYSQTFGNRTRIGWLAPGTAERASGTVRMRELATLDGAGLEIDNFEGVAALPGADGRTVVWIVSDDNFSDEQKTLLYRFSFDEGALGPGA